MRLRDWWNRLFVGESLADAGFPSHEDLASVGLTGAQFYVRYIAPEKRHLRIQSYNRAILRKFWRDYPSLDPKKPWHQHREESMTRRRWCFPFFHLWVAVDERNWVGQAQRCKRCGAERIA